MPKRSQKQVDQDEKEILFELKNNADASLDAIASKLKFSRQKIWRVKKRLERDRIVWGYTAVADLEKTNLKHFTLLIKRTTEPIDEKTIDILSSNQLNQTASKIGVNIETSAYTNGEYDWILTFTALNILQAKQFCEMLNKQLSKFILSENLVETLFFVKHHHVGNPDAKKLNEFF